MKLQIRFWWTFGFEMSGLLIALLFVLSLNDVTDLPNSFIRRMRYVVIFASILAIVVFFPGGWESFKSIEGKGSEPVNLNLTSQVIPIIVLIDTVGLCILIICTGGADKSLFTPLLFGVPIVAIILSESKTSWPYIYIGFTGVAYGISLFVGEITSFSSLHTITTSFTINRRILYKIMCLIATAMSIACTMISYRIQRQQGP